MDPEAAAVITPNLLVGETILWCGRPHDTSALRLRTLMIIVVGIAAIVMGSMPLDTSLAISAHNNSIMLALLVGVLIAEAIIFHTYLSNTYYAVTNQRVIIVSGFRELEMAAVMLGILNTPRLCIRRINRTVALIPPVNRSGALPFTNPSVPPDWTGNDWYRLLALEDPRHVYDLIVESTNNLK